MKRIQKFTVYPETHIKAVVTNDGNLEQTLDKTKSEVVEELIGLAPQTLDTLEEIANAINNDESFATTIDNALKNKADKTYVDGIADDFNVKERVIAAALVDLAARIEALENNNN